jgi:hypothetical protein
VSSHRYVITPEPLGRVYFGIRIVGRELRREIPIAGDFFPPGDNYVGYLDGLIR